ENAKLRAQLFKKVSVQKNNTCGTSKNTKFAKQSILRKPPMLGEIHALSKPVTSNSVSIPQESKVVNNDKVIAPGIFRINPFKTSRRPQPRRNTKNDKVLSASKSSRKKQKKRKPKVKKPKKVGFIERLATPKPSKPRSLLRWSPTGIMFDLNGKIIASSESDSQSDYSKGDNACYPDLFMVRRLGLFQAHDRKSKDSHQVRLEVYGNCPLRKGSRCCNFRVYFIEGLGHNLFSIGQFYDSDLEVAFRRNAYFVRNLEGIALLKGYRSTNLYTINLHEMASASPICIMARASSTKSWLWHQRLSHLNFDTINDLARNDLVSGLPKFKYNKEHLCPSCEQGKRKRASHPPKPNSSINGKQYILVIVDDYSRYTWVYFLRSKDEAPAVIITLLKRITVLLQSPVISIRTDN
nr:retrovirus-related Pol polyprotein from transposon TNT 1-94 [Tanacetum cinerariifolium]